MNTRIVRRHLMRHRQTIFWGHRAFCAVAIPLDLFPVQPPARAALSAGWLQGGGPGLDR